jgi:hypothetical protein
MWKDRFGFLPTGIRFEFDGGSVAPLPDFKERQESVAKRANPDGFAYPRRVVTVQQNAFPSPNGDPSPWEEIPGTERPGLVDRLPPSHEIVLGALDANANCRVADGAFVVHLIGYLFGARLQFGDWWLDMRIPVKTTHGVHVGVQDAAEFVSTAYKTWQMWDGRARKLMTNALYMDARSPCYEWEWEGFTVNYMVFDALYRLAVECLGVQKANHRERFKTLVDRFGLADDEQRWSEIYGLRNELFHEALWDNSHPCTDGSTSAAYASLNLRHLNHRIIPALLGFDTRYIASPWWVFDNFLFVER